MKTKISILIMLAAIFVTSFAMTGCCCCIPMEECDICGDYGANHEVQAMTTWHLCDDCYYDYLNDYNSGYGTCQDCGRSIADDRLYCDKCLGYGVCQDCGRSIADDRLYCDKCLGYGVCQDCGKKIADDRLYCNDCLYD